MNKERFSSLRHVLLGATSLAAVWAVPAAAQGEAAQTGEVVRPTSSEESPGIVIRNDINPNVLPPVGNLDSGINGVGQMTIRNSPTTTGMGVCTGTLINPRMVIFAAHCVNTRPAEAYGPNGAPFGAHTAGGTPIAFGFKADNLPAVRQWLGLDGGTAGATNIANALYAVEQVWYDPRSRAAASCTNPTSCFLQADVAIATLDTPAFDIPTWAMLFSPLDGPTHATITGYGNRGNENSASLAIDWRRRSAENMIAVLGSLNDRNSWLFGSAHPATNNVYLFDFRDPNPGYNPAAGKFDFGLYGSNAALPREGTTAGGDSGGPLIVDEKYSRPVVAAVLSGGTRFFNAQAGHRYGTDSFYQPLHLYWDVIVANNPYVYAGNKQGNGDWEDAGHWVQLMDPTYMIDVKGELVNGLPDTPAQGVTPGGSKFGQICFLADCTTLSGTQAAGNGTAVFVPGGPGSTNFVPNNVSANPAQGVRARYYDVTLSAAGKTSLGSAVTIDRMTLDGQTRLDVKNGGTLKVLGTYNQIQGWTNVDGRVESGRDMLLVSGMLSGSGTVKAPAVTAVGAIVAPGGGDRVGTLTIDGSMVLSSASSLFIDASRNGADRLAVTGELALNGGGLVFNKTTDSPAPRHGQKFDIATANLVTGTFGKVFSFQGVLRPEISYTANVITAELRAGSLVTILDGQNPTALAFAGALDSLRSTSYNALFGLYGAVDLMDGATLSRTLAGLAPTAIATETLSFQDRQSKVMLGAVTDRLSSLGARGTGGTLSVVGSPEALGALMGNPNGLTGTIASGIGGSRGFVGGERVAGAMPEHMSGFITGGVTSAGSSFGDNRMEVAGQRSWNVGMGLEMEVAEGATLGTAFAFANGLALPGGENARVDSRAAQAAVYGSYQLGDGAYVAGLAAAERSRTGIERQASNGEAITALTGATETARYSAMLETGVNMPVAKGLTLTPRASLGYSAYHLSGFREAGSEAALALDDLRLNRLDARVGAKFAGSTPVGRSGWSFVPQIQADWVQNLSGARSGMTVRFANAPDAAIALPLLDGDTSWTEVKGGMRLTNGSVEIGAGLEGSFGRQSFRDERAVADLTIRF